MIGVDNDEFLCKYTEPSLSSVIQDFEFAGHESLRLLDLQIRGLSVARLTVMPPGGIAVRESTEHLFSTSPALRQAVNFVRRNFADNISAKDVAYAAGVSRATLDNLARRCLGHTVHDIITSERLKRASALLVQTNLPMKQVAAKSGFASTQYFNHVFKRQAECTPAIYRRKSGQTASEIKSDLFSEKTVI